MIKIDSIQQPNIRLFITQFMVILIASLSGIGAIYIHQQLIPENIINLLFVCFLYLAFLGTFLNQKALLITSLFMTAYILLGHSFTKLSVREYPLEIPLYIGASGLFLTMLKVFMGKKNKYLAHREKHYHNIVRHSLHPIILKNKDGIVTETSESVSMLLDKKPKELRNKSLSEFIHEDDKVKHDEFLDKLLKNPGKRKHIRIRFKKKDGSTVWLQNDAINLLQYPEVNAIVSSLQDISKRVALDKHRKKVLLDETDARTKAENAVRERDEFLAIASHELRTPLTNVLLQLQVTLRQTLNQSLADFSGKTLVRNLSIAEQQSKRLSKLITDLLDVSLARTGNLYLEKSPIKISEVITKVVERFEQQIDQKGCSVDLNLKDTHEGDWDLVRLEQVFTNLLSNALKYCGGKPIKISSSSTNIHTKVSITNRGPVIKKEDMERIFKLFERAEQNKKNGIGIGLYISRRIVEAHGGTITLESTKKKGTIFTVKLPNN